MFIKKDLRKVPKILDDAIDCETSVLSSTKDKEGRDLKRPKVQEPLSELRLGRRQQEFQGSIKLLCQPKYLPKLQQLKSLNLYDCAISNLDGIGLFGECPNLEILNLGRNPLTTIPDEFSALAPSLKELWLDDCKLEGSLPKTITALRNLELLRVPHNALTEIPDEISNMTKLRILCLDRNPLSSGSLPDLRNLEELQELFVRHSNLSKLPALPVSLKVLHASSNPLTDLTVLMDSECYRLTQLYVNGCQLVSLPEGIVSRHEDLNKLMVSHNAPLKQASTDFWRAVDSSEENSPLRISWEPNPLLAASRENDGEGAASSEEEDDNGDVHMASAE